METSYDAEDLQADGMEVDEDLYQLNDIGLALRLDALRDVCGIRTSRSFD